MHKTFFIMTFCADWNVWTTWPRSSSTSVTSTRNGLTARRICCRLRTSRSAGSMSSRYGGRAGEDGRNVSRTQFLVRSFWLLFYMILNILLMILPLKKYYSKSCKIKCWLILFSHHYTPAQRSWRGVYWIHCTCHVVGTVVSSVPNLQKRFKNTYELLNLRALKFSPVNKIHIFQCMGKIMWNFKGALWNSTQNISPIHWKIQFLYCVEILSALGLKTS